jgi:hypothetical protein
MTGHLINAGASPASCVNSQFDKNLMKGGIKKMNETRMYVAVLAVVLAAFVFTSNASAQTYAGILDGQWFKVNLSVKGYTIAADGETVLGKGAGSLHAYLHFAYDEPTTSYTITTCMEDDIKGNGWHKGNSSGPIPIANIYGATYPQVWDLQGISLSFSNGVSSFDIYPTFYTKITADSGTLKNASISNVACTLYAGLEGGEYGTGSCTVKGPLVPTAKVAKTIPLACQ